ncbi:MAG: hypothetical protein ACK5B9_11815 [Flavobacteriia bacterium]|jgi:hypothetical protein
MLKYFYLILVFKTVFVSNSNAQNDPVLDKTYAKLKECYIDLTNNAIPFKEKGKWGLKSLDGKTLHQASLDSLYSLTTKAKLSVNYFIAKEKGYYKIIDCNGNLVFGKSFVSMQIPNLYQRKHIYACDSLNSYDIEIKNNTIYFHYYPKNLCGNIQQSFLKPSKTDFYFVISSNYNHYGCIISDSISRTSKITCYLGNTIEFTHQFNTTTERCELFEDRILYLRQNNKRVQYFVGSNKFYETGENETIYPINTDEFVVFKKNLIEFLDKNGNVISSIKVQYNEHAKEYFNKYTIRYLKEGKKCYKVIDIKNYRILEKELHANDFFFVLEDFYVCVSENKSSIVYNNSLAEIYKDTNANYFSYLPNFGPPILMICKNSFWKGIDTSGKILGNGYASNTKDLISKNGAFKIGDGSKSIYWDENPEACGVYMSGKLHLFSAHEIIALDSNRYFIKTKNDKYNLIDTNKNVLLKNVYLDVVKSGPDFILETRDENGLVYQINSKNEKIISKNMYVSMFDLTKSKVESPFMLYHDSVNKFAYGLVDENYKVIQPNEYKIILAVNKNFIVVDKNYEIGYLDHNGARLF